MNTDTRTFSNVTLSQEYVRLRETFGWDAEDFFQCKRKMGTLAQELQAIQGTALIETTLLANFNSD